MKRVKQRSHNRPQLSSDLTPLKLNMSIIADKKKRMREIILVS